VRGTGPPNSQTAHALVPRMAAHSCYATTALAREVERTRRAQRSFETNLVPRMAQLEVAIPDEKTSSVEGLELALGGKSRQRKELRQLT
jgi:hypothetical protein